MSGRVAYLNRTDRGFRPAGLRLVGERTDEAFACVPSDSPDDRAELERMADWVRERVPRGAPGVDVLCIDAEGSLCSWLSSPSANPGVVGALARQGGTDTWNAGEQSTAAADVLGVYSGVAAESSVQALATEAPAARQFRRPRAKVGAPSARQRMAVLAMPDATARVLLDELDLRSVRVGSVCSLWHAMSAAWDPGASVHSRAVGTDGANAPARIVADSPSVHATVLLDRAGRLLWSWSSRGNLLAGGSVRLRTPQASGAGEAAFQVRQGDLSRLATDWLAWSIQLGSAPARVTCVVPGVGTGEGALEEREIGEALGRACPGATVDLAVDEDPIGSTLRRLAVAASSAQDSGEASPLRPEDPSASLITLTHRPGRAHFRLYLWASLTLVIASVGISVVAIQQWISASRTRLAAAKTNEQWRQKLLDLKLGNAPFPGQELLALEKEVERIERDSKPVTPTEPAMPVLQELDALSFVLGYPGVHLEEINLSSTLVRPRIVCQVEKIGEGEMLFTALKQLGGSNIVGWSSNYINLASGKTKCTFTGSWAPTAKTEKGGA